MKAEANPAQYMRNLFAQAKTLGGRAVFIFDDAEVLFPDRKSKQKFSEGFDDRNRHAAAGIIASSLEAEGRSRLPTALADSHVVPTNNDAAVKMVYGTSDELLRRISQLRAKTREDERGKLYWPGQPVINWLTTEGAGQSVQAAYFAQALGAELIRLTGAQLRCMESPGYLSSMACRSSQCTTPQQMP